MTKENVWDLVVVVAIAGLGLVASWVTFGVLDSSAEGDYQGFAVGGAIAGAVVTWLVLGGLYRTLRKSSMELSKIVDRSQSEVAELRRQNLELQMKVMRGMDLPTGWAPEAIERQRIVLARPDEWVARGGTVFQLTAPESDRAETGANGETVELVDPFPATFQLNHYTLPAERRNDDPEQTYREVVSSVDDGTVYNFMAERILVGSGGDPKAGVPSLKMVTTEAIWVELERTPVIGNVSRNWGSVPINHAIGIRQYLLEQGTGPVSSSSDSSADSPAEDLSATDGSDLSSAAVLSDEERSEIAELIRAYGDPSISLPGGEPHRQFSAGEIHAVQLLVVVQRMRVLCVNRQIGTMFDFDFVDDIDDFESQTVNFNAVLSSVRFLPETV